MICLAEEIAGSLLTFVVQPVCLALTRALLYILNACGPSLTNTSLEMAYFKPRADLTKLCQQFRKRYKTLLVYSKHPPASLLSSWSPCNSQMKCALNAMPDKEST